MARNEDIENLYIIGNGFDLHHKIQCKYSDFHKWLCLNNPMLENRLFQVYELHHNDFWSSFETNLGALTVESILEGYVYAPMLLFAKHANGDMIALETDNYTGSIGEIGYTLERLFNDLQIAFADWIFQLEDANPTYKIQIDKSKSSFISFNYTQTLEQVYGVNPSDILYLHGCSTWDTNLIFGHNLTPEKLLKNWQNNYSEEELEVLIGAANEMSIIFKDVNGIIDRHTAYWEAIRNIQRIHIWGLSLSEVDMPYISHIRSIVSNDVEWEFSWLTKTDKEMVKKVIEKLQIKNYSLVTLNDLLCNNNSQLELFSDLDNQP